jgi:hypothetical protein
MKRVNSSRPVNRTAAASKHRRRGAAIDAVAARVLGVGRKKPAEEKLLARASRIKDRVKKAEALKAADRAMRTRAKRMISPAAEARAKRALERARWEREN